MTTGGFFIIYLLILATIYFMAPDNPQTNFPDGCPKTPNCTRVADKNIRGEGLKPLVFNSSVQEIHDLIITWILDQPRTEILTDIDNFIHAKFLSLVFRFPDDFYVSIFQNENNQTTFWVQSQSRLGRGDLGVNEQRVQSFFEYMAQFQSV